MNYEKSRKEFYESEIHRIAPQLAEMLDNGYTAEISKSRSGLKLFAVTRKHEVLKRGGKCNE